jgi:hypothetical protein
MNPVRGEKYPGRGFIPCERNKMNPVRGEKYPGRGDNPCERNKQ